MRQRRSGEVVEKKSIASLVIIMLWLNISDGTSLLHIIEQLWPVCGCHTGRRIAFYEGEAQFHAHTWSSYVPVVPFCAAEYFIVLTKQNQLARYWPTRVQHLPLIFRSNVLWLRGVAKKVPNWSYPPDSVQEMPQMIHVCRRQRMHFTSSSCHCTYTSMTVLGYGASSTTHWSAYIMD